VELEFLGSVTQDFQPFLRLIHCECRDSFLPQFLEFMTMYLISQTDFEDARFLRSNFSERIAQNALMIDAEGRDPSDNRLWDNIRTIVSTSNSNFEDRRVDLEVKLD
jgi:hypothetical protein